MDDLNIEQVIAVGCPAAIILLFILIRVLRNIDPRGGKW